MKKIKLLALSALACAVSILFSSYHGGAGTNGYDCTGAETGLGNGPGCYYGSGGGCHSTSASSKIAVTVELDSAGGKKTNYYVGGGKYTIKIVGKNNGTTSQPAFGFEVGVIQGSVAVTTPTNEGTFNSPYPTNVQYTPTPNPSWMVLNVVEQSTQITPTSGSGGNGTTYQEVINWTAPAKGTGTCSIWGVLNAVNYNGSADAGDLWNTAHTTITEINPTGVNEVAADNEVNVYPNPFTVRTTFTLSNEVNNAIVYMYDLTGKEVQKVTFSGKEFSLDRNNLPNGIYFYNIVSDNQSIKTGRIIAQ